MASCIKIAFEKVRPQSLRELQNVIIMKNISHRACRAAAKPGKEYLMSQSFCPTPGNLCSKDLHCCTCFHYLLLACRKTFIHR